MLLLHFSFQITSKHLRNAKKHIKPHVDFLNLLEQMDIRCRQRPRESKTEGAQAGGREGQRTSGDRKTERVAEQVRRGAGGRGGERGPRDSKTCVPQSEQHVGEREHAAPSGEPAPSLHQKPAYGLVLTSAFSHTTSMHSALTSSLKSPAKHSRLHSLIHINPVKQQHKFLNEYQFSFKPTSRSQTLSFSNQILQEGEPTMPNIDQKQPPQIKRAN